MANLTKLATEDGAAYIALDSVVLISQPMERNDKPIVRRVGLGNGLYVLALNTPANLRILGLTDEAAALEKPKRVRKARS